MANASVEARVVLRLAFDVGEPLVGVDRNKRDYEMSSFQGDGMMYIGDQALPVQRFQVAMFKRDGDPTYALVRSLKRGDRVEVALPLEVRPYAVRAVDASARDRERWAMQPGQPYRVKVLDRAQVGELLEV